MSVRPARPPKEAFQLIRQILSEGPKSLQAIVTAGLKLHPVPASSSKPVKATRPYIEHPEVPESLRKIRVPLKATKIPQGHPFRSNHYLKHHILEELSRHRLIAKECLRSQTSDKNATARLIKANAGSAFRFMLATQPIYPDKDPLKKWSLPKHWESLCSGVHPTTVLMDYNMLQKVQKETIRERQLANGTLERTEQEIWEWPDRNPATTTRLQRTHMNRRKQKGRTEKEARVVRLTAKFEAQRKATHSRHDELWQSMVARGQTAPESRGN